MDDLSEKLNELRTENTEDSLSGDSSTSSSHHGPGRWFGPRMPELKMPLFNGSVAEFTHCEQLFDQLIGACPDMNGTAKMSYLLEAVRPTVTKLISRLGLTPAGYSAARKLLKKKYGRADLLVAAEITTLTSSHKSPEGEGSDWETPMQDAPLIFIGLKHGF